MRLLRLQCIVRDARTHMKYQNIFYILALILIRQVSRRHHIPTFTHVMSISIKRALYVTCSTRLSLYKYISIPDVPQASSSPLLEKMVAIMSLTVFLAVIASTTATSSSRAHIQTSRPAHPKPCNIPARIPRPCRTLVARLLKVGLCFGLSCGIPGQEGQLLPKGTIHLYCLLICIPTIICRSFDQYCDLSSQYDQVPSPAVLPDRTVVPPYKGPGVDTFIKECGRYDLLDYSKFKFLVFRVPLYFLAALLVNTYWINQGAPNSDFWGHEVSHLFHEFIQPFFFWHWS